ncbi:DeoR/GlpR family DNA-binding transcription regulator [Fuscibacter oryzae]|uniref:DeoR/GlpR transcriptional regulator n=1 Tax=Fuscibacter oryzae TaxID=2803939 RepID=A0A8J7MUN3_9RHOB|nr:DeoR/GlpR family DNA-binding transcription regulator [Fuscibacter oryzae]MBL4928763.1 DeoR/GlpR transcriptional regulator [Fuscibacter oryzae]
MLAEERTVAIQHRLKRDGRVVAADLAQEFAVSEDTIRRDLRDLAKAGLCRKVYGGALLVAGPAPKAGPIMQRSTLAADDKARLAVAAAGLIAPGQIVFLDAASTNLAIAGAIPRALPVTVVTNTPAIAVALSDHAHARVILLGGVFDAERGGCFGGAAIAALQQINADLFFVGACGLHGQIGVTAFDPAEAELKRAMAQQSTRLAVAATSDKIATIAPFRVAPADAVDHLVILPDADPQTVEMFQRLGTNVHLAGRPS